MKRMVKSGRKKKRPVLRHIWEYFAILGMLATILCTLVVGLKIGESRGEIKYARELKDTRATLDSIWRSGHRQRKNVYPWDTSGVKRLLARADAGYREDSNLFREVDSLFQKRLDSLGRNDSTPIEPHDWQDTSEENSAPVDTQRHKED
jgi:hypothetical protein